LEAIELKAKPRAKTGNGPARVLRREGMVPAVIYGPGKEPAPLTVALHDLDMVLRERGGQAMINLAIEGEDGKRMAMVKEIQRHPVSRKVLHADFYEVAMDREITLTVPLTVTGVSPGVEAGGVLQVVRRELEVSCLPMAVPEEITVDISGLQVGDSIHISEVALPEGVTTDVSLDYTVVTVVAPRAEEEAVPAEEEEGEEAEAPEETGEAVEAAGETEEE